MFDSEFSNKVSAFLAAAIGLFMFLYQIFPDIENNINMINASLMLFVPVEYQSIVQILLTLLSLSVAVIVYVYNYTTSKTYAEEHAKHKVKNFKQLYFEDGQLK